MGTIFLVKCLLTLDCSRAGAVPATHQNFPCPAFFSAPDPTHYCEYIYYHMTTPHQPSLEAKDFWGSGAVTTETKYSWGPHVYELLLPRTSIPEDPMCIAVTTKDKYSWGPHVYSCYYWGQVFLRTPYGWDVTEDPMCTEDKYSWGPHVYSCYTIIIYQHCSYSYVYTFIHIYYEL